MFKNFLVVAAVIAALFMLTGVAGAAELLVADFDSGSKPCNMGGDFGAWDKDPADFSQGCTDNFDPMQKIGSKGFSMRLDYDVDSPNPAYNGFWLKLEGLDATKYKNITFGVKGDTEAGYTTVLKLELKNNKGEVGKFYITGVDDTWQTITVPLRNFAGIADFSSLSEFVMIFEDRMATNKDGTIYLDNIRFTN